MANNINDDRILVNYDLLEKIETDLLSLKQELEARKVSFEFSVSKGSQTEQLKELLDIVNGIGEEFHTLVERTYLATKAVFDEYVDVERKLCFIKVDK